MIETARWFLALQLVALAALPLCLSVLRPLHDRGYALSKAFGLLLVGYVFWLSNSLHVVPNSRAGISVAMAVVLAISLAVSYTRRREAIVWCRSHWRYAVGVEVLFAGAFLVAAVLRAHVGQLTGSESNMDFMFLNASLRAEHFPPKDPWLAGYSVSYYYFGFVLVALVTQIAYLRPEVGYNLGVATVAALTIVSVFGVVYNLLPAQRDGGLAPIRPRPPRPALFGLLGAAMVAVMGNLAWLFVFASSYGLGSKRFYQLLDLGVPAGIDRATWYPSSAGAYGLVTHVYPIASGFQRRSVIQFPMFSFVLGDLHAHVLALPFVVLAVGFILAMAGSSRRLGLSSWRDHPAALLASAVVLGSLGFLNSWDLPVVALVLLASAFAVNATSGFGLRRVVLDTVLFAAPLLVLAVAAYVPFYASFHPDAGGIKPVVQNAVEPHPGVPPLSFLVQWAPLLAPIALMLTIRMREHRQQIRPAHVMVAALVPLAVVAAWIALVVFGETRDSGQLRGADGVFVQVADRGVGWLTDVMIAALLVAALLVAWLGRRNVDGMQRHMFAVALAIVGLSTVLASQFVYVDDIYNSRLNTVFKLYYSAWALLALAAALALCELVEALPSTRPSRWSRPALAACGMLLAVGLLYPGFAIPNRIRPYAGAISFQQENTLDGLAFVGPDERAGIHWLRTHVDGQDAVIAESTEQRDILAFEGPARISAMTGIPTVLGSPGHVDTWRRNSKQLRAGRIEDMDELYRTPDLLRAGAILAKYGVAYVYVGAVERGRYAAESLAKFAAFPVAFQQGAVAIYATPRAAIVGVDSPP